MFLVQNLLQLCGMLAVVFGAIYLSFAKGPLPFTVGFTVDASHAIGLFGLVGTVLKGAYGYFRRIIGGRPTVKVVV